VLSNKDGVIKVMTDNGVVLFHTSHTMQVPSNPCTRGVYGIVDIQANETRDLPIRDLFGCTSTHHEKRLEETSPTYPVHLAIKSCKYFGDFDSEGLIPILRFQFISDYIEVL